MEPDERHEEELPRPTGVPVTMDRVISKLQERSAAVVQNLTWDLATRDATIEALQERLDEETQLRQEAESVLTEYIKDLREAREQVSKLVEGQDFLMRQVEQLTKDRAEAYGQGRDDEAAGLDLPKKDAFLEASNIATENAETELVPVPAASEQ